MNLMEDRAHHTILSAMPDALGARDAIAPGIRVDFPKDAPPLHGRPSLPRYRDLARYMRGFDLLLSYNWGAMYGVMAHRLHRGRIPARLIHHEDGFNEDESVRTYWKRNMSLRPALAHVSGVVVHWPPLQIIAATAHEK